MRQSSYSIGAAQKDIRALAGDHYVNINLKVKKTNVTSSLVNGVLEAGTLISKDGKTVVTTAGQSGAANTTTAYGIVYADVDFNNSYSTDGVADNATEVVPVMIHGFVKESLIKLNSTTALATTEKEALSMIAFL